MTMQCPEELINENLEIDFEGLELYDVVSWDAAKQEMRRYPFTTKPNKHKFVYCSALWRGYIATYRLTRENELIFERMSYPFFSEKPAFDDCFEKLKGDFWLKFSDSDDSIKVCYVPFVNGRLIVDKKFWKRINNFRDSMLFERGNFLGEKFMENAVKNRKIEYVWHFTKIENLDSILKHGLIPRAYLEAESASVQYNDSYRLDGCKDANCLSIGHPNYKMFYRLRQDNPQQEWVVIVIDSKILWLKECAFCYENAASSKVTCKHLLLRKGVKAFECLFEPADDKPNRQTLGLSDDCPTNPQAEVLVFGLIEPEYIVGAIVPSKNRENELKEMYPDFAFVYNKGFYSPRLDYAYW